ncbi:MAG: hypothetical protein RPU64_00120 [Candidatus Sedimenticola sp. (ex Thyasira tokunagai)]
MGEIVFGVRVGEVEVQTRIHLWKITPKGKEQESSEPYSYRVSVQESGGGKADAIGVENAIGSKFPEIPESGCSYLEFCQ